MLGPNGSGKSTLLRAIAATQTPMPGTSASTARTCCACRAAVVRGSSPSWSRTRRPTCRSRCSTRCSSAGSSPVAAGRGLGRRPARGP
ncbi:ATP-binding cassette domain-containing protein [Oerskovia sp. M15]